jgi:hypothetical protein
MQFGLPKPEPERPEKLRWDSTAKRAQEMQDWARDAALLPYAGITPPDRNAAEGTPGSTWRLKIKTEVPAEQGGGWQWVDVPDGATVHFSGTEEDPVFSVRTPRMAAQKLQQGDA